ncbi:MAG: acyl-CoA dehydrogenase family protein [Planctomycetes bacterium]|nr:acyl-CoA dehydrogenase family protein [Planctomycetota bacterium]
MELFISQDEFDVYKMASEFAEKEIHPLASSIDKNEKIPKEVFNKLKEVGFMGVTTPEQYGGSGLNNVSLFLIQVAINRACAATGVTMSVHNSLVQGPINKFGSQFQKDKYLKILATGDEIGAYCLSEPTSGSDAGSLKTAAEKKNGVYILNGSKNFITNGNYADIFIIFARTIPDQSLGPKGISAFIVEKSYKGLSVGKNEKKLGIKGSSTTQIFLDSCEVPSENLLGVENEGFKIAMNTLDGGRIGIAAQAIGIALACLDESVKYSLQRTQFGKPIADHQAIKWKVADMATEIEAAFLMGIRAAKLKDMGVAHTKEASMAKLFASSIVNKHCTEAVQIHGGAGYLKDFSVERYFRDAKITEIYEGTSEVQHLVIARSILNIK